MTCKDAAKTVSVEKESSPRRQQYRFLLVLVGAAFILPQGGPDRVVNTFRHVFHLLPRILSQAVALGKSSCFNPKNFNFEPTSLLLLQRVCYTKAKYRQRGMSPC